MVTSNKITASDLGLPKPVRVTGKLAGLKSGELQARVEPTPEWAITGLCEAIDTGLKPSDIELIDVIEITDTERKGERHIWDGEGRTESYRRKGITDITYNLTYGTWSQALILGAFANRNQKSRPRDSGDQTKAALNALRGNQGMNPKWSATKLAEFIGVSESTVRNAEKMLQEGQSPQPEQDQGDTATYVLSKNGVLRRIAAKAQPKAPTTSDQPTSSSSRLAGTDGVIGPTGFKYGANIDPPAPPEVVKDSLGRIIPEPLVARWIANHRAIDNLIEKIRIFVAMSIKAKEDFIAPGIDLEGIHRAAKLMREAIEKSRFKCVCPEVDDTGKHSTSNCETCNLDGRGMWFFITPQRYATMSPQQRLSCESLSEKEATEPIIV